MSIHTVERHNLLRKNLDTMLVEETQKEKQRQQDEQNQEQNR